MIRTRIRRKGRGGVRGLMEFAYLQELNRGGRIIWWAFTIVLRWGGLRCGVGVGEVCEWQFTPHHHHHPPTTQRLSGRTPQHHPHPFA